MKTYNKSKSRPGQIVILILLVVINWTDIDWVKSQYGCISNHPNCVKKDQYKSTK